MADAPQYRQLLQDWMDAEDAHYAAAQETLCFDTPIPRAVIERVRNAIEAARTALSAPLSLNSNASLGHLTERAGYRLAPSEPTEVMVRAGNAAYWAAQPKHGETRYTDNDAAVVYKAMLSAVGQGTEAIAAPNEQKAPLSLNAAIEYMISENNRLHDELVAAKAAPSPVAPEPVAWLWIEDPWGANDHHVVFDDPQDPKWRPLYAHP